MNRRLPKLVLAFVIAAIMAASVDSQSGRGHPDAAKPTLATATPTPAVDSPALASKVMSLLITGEIIHDGQYFKSSYFDGAIKEFVRAMEMNPRPFFSTTKGDEMKLEAAIDLAKKHPDTHVIWLGFVTKNGYRGEMFLDRVEYSVLAQPRGKVLTMGTLTPGQQSVVGQGGIMTIPRMPRQHSPSLLMQMKQSSREIVYRLKGSGWF